MKFITPIFITLLAVSTVVAQVEDSVVDLEEELATEQYDSSYTTTEEDAYDDEAYEESDSISYSPNQLKEAKHYQSEKINIKKFDQKKWKEIIGSTNYDEDKKKKEAEKKKANNPIRFAPWNSEILKIISFMVITALVIFIIYYIVKNISVSSKLKKTSLSGENGESAIENIEELDINTLLQKALKEGNLRLAVRLYYLALLKKLNASGLIVWQREKTNRDYLSELFSGEHFQDVKLLTLAYEKIWYGEHSLTKEMFDRLSTDFESLNQKLNTTKAQ
jgi:hypothetical protein